MFDRQPENIRRTALYAMSYWVVYTYHAEEANNNNTGDDVQFWSDVAMDNVLLIQKTTANKADLSTLMWRENNTREFEKLEIDWNDKIDLFPNSHFGFNGRQLLTTAVQYKGYVELSEKNGDLVIEGGVCGDIVKILCNKLNFT